MQNKGEIYFDIHSEESGGTLLRMQEPNGDFYFLYDYSVYDASRDEVSVSQKRFPDFVSFWQYIKSNNRDWCYLHPLFIHPEQRDFITDELKNVNWESQEGRKWQESHQRQWKKVLTDPPRYYRPG
jgi:hypothetical protein